MHKIPWGLYLWPGLPQLWRRGSWFSLALALLAALLLNCALVLTFGWSELLNPLQRNILWITIASGWTVASISSARVHRHQTLRERPSPKSDPFIDALEAYLQGNYFQAEQLAHAVLQYYPRDLETHLLLATLYRRNRRPEEARQQLDRLCHFEGAEKWGREIEHELALLAEGYEAEADPATEEVSNEDEPKASNEDTLLAA